MNKHNHILLVVAAIVSIFFSSCNKGMNIQPALASNQLATQNVGQIINKDVNFSLFREAVSRTGINSLLSGSNKITLFAPTDQAFYAAGYNTNSDIEAANVDTLKAILLYHLIPNVFKTGNLSSGSSVIVTENGKSINVINEGNNLSVNGIPVSIPNINATNGVIHVVQSIIFPPTKNLISQIAVTPTLSFLAAAITRASTGKTNLIGLLSSTGPYTLFAPSNTAFISAGFTSMDVINTTDPDLLTHVLLTNVINAEIFTPAFPSGALPPTLDTLLLTTTQSSNLSIGETVLAPGNNIPAKITQGNGVALNGVYHIIDQVLLPPLNLAQTIATNTSFTLFNAAIKRTGLNILLSQTGPFTVIAPNDSAFLAAGFTPSYLATINVDTLKSLILYHILPGIFTRQQLLADITNTPIITDNGKNIYVNEVTGFSSKKAIYINGKYKIGENDFVASNGIIHLSNSVLLPPTQSILSIIQSTPNLSYFAAAISRVSKGSTNLTALLSSPGPFTVLAPDTAAFISAGYKNIAAINQASIALLTPIITLHIIPSQLIFSFSFVPYQPNVTLNGETIYYTYSSSFQSTGTPTANLVSVNLLGLNGIVDVIDHVLLP